MSSRKKILLLTLVHPDFLPPVYATALVLRDEGYAVEIITFNSLVPAENESDEGITICEVGEYHNKSFFQRLSLRRKFNEVVQNKMREQPVLVVSFCTFSFLSAETQKRQVPHAHIALEINNTPERFNESPLTFMRIQRTFSKISGAEFVATPSVQRSAWLAGKCGLRSVPHTIQNTTYYKAAEKNKSTDLLKTILPEHFLEKKAFLYAGRLNSNYSVHELVMAFGQLNDGNAVLVITGFRENDPYCIQLRQILNSQPNSKNILLLPVVPRQELAALQEYAHIGICFLYERLNDLETQMAAPNKIGEYIANGLYLLTNKVVYTAQFQNAGVATLIDQPAVDQIQQGMAEALLNVGDLGFAKKIDAFYRDEYCMQQQARPIIEFLKSKQRVES
ncbi:glycosyltransferase [Polluticoccus soli]|uniref:glycosyltransferase n=1 Tax=Polluticoccus soli TaxID=3034150 RepID=UPI0023E22720|nr:glycosyltransferase [Flavipsychrobacter sp. JY13-12]